MRSLIKRRPDYIQLGHCVVGDKFSCNAREQLRQWIAVENQK